MGGDLKLLFTIALAITAGIDNFIVDDFRGLSRRWCETLANTSVKTIHLLLHSSFINSAVR